MDQVSTINSIWAKVRDVYSGWKLYIWIVVGILILWVIWRWRTEACLVARRREIDFACRSIPESETIFVSIASYRDSQCAETIFDLFEKAACPFRITVGVCQQNYPVDDDVIESYRLLARKGIHDFSNRIRIVRLSADEAQGPMLARHLIEKKLYRDEKYYMVTDSHMMFVPGWDRKAVDMLRTCSQWSAKPVLTMYPEDFKTYHRTWGLPNYENQPGAYLRFKKFNDTTGIVEIEGPKFKRKPSTPVLGMFWGACFSFGFGCQVNEVPFDPHCPYVFIGEEISMAVRLWTSGYDLYHPNEMIVYHMWERKRPTFWQQFDQSNQEHQRRRQLEKTGYHRLKCLLGIEHSQTIMPPYGLGKVRTLEAYQDFVGINFGSKDKNKSFTSLSGLIGLPNYSKSADVLCRFGTWKEFHTLQETMQHLHHLQHKLMSYQ